ncbi:MAG: LysR family transcriptional regulator [Firmicutes bacterium]|nr:LysR family transcriptional regulator [Bacillota bacterium]
MIDPKIRTLLTVASVGNFTQTGRILSLTQPAVSYHIKTLEKQYGINIFYRGKRQLTPTPEGEILLNYARRILNLEEAARQDLADRERDVRRFNVGITTTLAEHLVPQIFVNYCNSNPNVHVNIFTDTVRNIYNMLSSYELDWAIVEGKMPKEEYISIPLDTDYLCLVVSPKNKLAQRASVSLQELKQEKFILRPSNAGTRSLFENHLLSLSKNINDFNIVIETNNIKTIKELVASNLGVTIIAYSAVERDLERGKLAVVPVKDFHIVREINIVYHKSFRYAAILDGIRKNYTRQDGRA